MSKSASPDSGKLDPTLDFVAGTAAGISGLVVGFPFDTVKYRFQNPSPDARYRSTVHALVTIAREERLRGLFKGISSPLATAPLLNGMLFAAYGFLMKIQMHTHDNGARSEEQPTLGQIFLAGAGCGLASTLLTTPIELIKIQQQKHQQLLHTTRETLPTSASASARAVALHIYRTGGIRALYRGLSATIWRDVGGFGLYFYGYEGTLRLFAGAPVPTPVYPVPAPAHHHHPDSNSDSFIDDTDTLYLHRPHSRPWAAPLFAGAAAGVLGWIATFPFDVLKTRLQAGTIGVADTGLGSSWRMAQKMYYDAESGGRGRVFWRGLVPTLVRAVPVNMAVFGTFETVIRAFSTT